MKSSALVRIKEMKEKVSKRKGKAFTPIAFGILKNSFGKKSSLAFISKARRNWR